jgi:hypothetical protein
VEREVWLQEIKGLVAEAAWEGVDALPPTAQAVRAQLQQHARELLRAGVAAQARRLSSASAAEVAAARQVLEGVRSLPVLASVRDPLALTDLPEPERHQWQARWKEVVGLLRGTDSAR